jgi:chemotaxis protein methyltransferase CheR
MSPVPAWQQAFLKGRFDRMLKITQEEFERLANYIQANYGIHLHDEKQNLVLGRLQNVLLQNDFKTFTDYFNYVLADKTGEAAATLINRITTNHTYFMREVEHFYYFRDKVLPYLKTVIRDNDLRVWSAGCSSGEEPYTLAMLVDEYMGKEKLWWDTKILATDISSKALEEAKSGVYSNQEIATLPTNWRLNYFKKLDNENSVIADRIKNEVIFRKFNLMEEVFPFKRKFHVIFCRNVMIYFDAPTKNKLVEKFYNHLEYGGYLFIGHSESLDREKTKFKYVMPALFRKE